MKIGDKYSFLEIENREDDYDDYGFFRFAWRHERKDFLVVGEKECVLFSITDNLLEDLVKIKNCEIRDLKISMTEDSWIQFVVGRRGELEVIYRISCRRDEAFTHFQAELHVQAEYRNAVMQDFIELVRP